MTDEHEPTSEDSLDPLEPAEEARLRALLADLGSGGGREPLPAAVASRLDDTLAKLVAERAEDDHDTARVVPLRRRWASRTTAAAAAVIVVAGGGVAAATFGLLGPGAGPAADYSGSAESAAGAEPGAGSDAGTGRAEPDGSPDSTSPVLPDALAGTTAASPGTEGLLALPRLGSATFAADVEALLGRRTTSSSGDGQPQGEGGTGTAEPQEASPDEKADEKAGQQSGEAYGDDRTPAQPPRSGTARAGSCPGPDAPGDVVRRPVLLDGRPAALLVRPESGGRQVVEAWDCAGDRTLAVTTLRP